MYGRAFSLTVQYGLYGPLWSYMVLCSLVLSCVVLYGFVWSFMVFSGLSDGLLWSCMVLYGPLRSCLILARPIMVLYSLFGSCMVSTVLFCLSSIH